MLHRTLFVVLIMTFMLAVPGRAPAQEELRYMGPAADGRRARVEVQGRFYDVREGDEIPGVGTVLEMKEEHITVRRIELPESAPANAPGALHLNTQIFRRQSKQGDDAN